MGHGGQLQRCHAAEVGGTRKHGLDAAWSSAPMVQQIQSLQAAYQSCLLKGIPAGILARSILQAACFQAAKNAVSQEIGQVQGGEMANIVGLLYKHLQFKTVRWGPTSTS